MIFPFSVFKISGHSMEPSIEDGSLVLFEKITFLFREPKVGDVVLITWQGKPVIKRVVSIVGNTYLVAGENLSDSLPIPKLNRKKLLARVWKL